MAFEQVTQQIGQMPQLALQARVAALQEASRRQQLSRMDQKQFVDFLSSGIDQLQRGQQRKEDVAFRDDQAATQADQFKQEMTVKTKMADAKIAEIFTGIGLTKAQTDQFIATMPWNVLAAKENVLGMQANTANTNANTDKTAQMTPGAVRLQENQADAIPRSGDQADRGLDQRDAALSLQAKELDAKINNWAVGNNLTEAQAEELRLLMNPKKDQIVAGTENLEERTNQIGVDSFREDRKVSLAEKTQAETQDWRDESLSLEARNTAIRAAEQESMSAYRAAQIELDQGKLKLAEATSPVAAERELGDQRAKYSKDLFGLQRELMVLASSQVTDGGELTLPSIMGGGTLKMTKEAREWFRAAGSKIGESANGMATSLNPGQSFADALKGVEGYSKLATDEEGDDYGSRTVTPGGDGLTPAERAAKARLK